MRRFLSIVLAVLLVLMSCMVGVFAVSDDEILTGPNATGADVTIGDAPEYEITAIPDNAVPVHNQAEFVSMKVYGVYYLANDLTLNASNVEFRGQLFGNGKTVTTSVPLFKKLDSAHVCDITIEGEITVTATTHTGALANYASAVTVRSVTNKANLQGTLATTGIIGQLANTSTFTNCVNYGNISTAPDAEGNVGEAAGIVGSLNDGNGKLVLTLIDCVNYGEITSPSNAGGIIGWTGPVDNTTQTVIMNGCKNYGDIIGTADFRVGGLIATTYSQNLYLDSCANYGDIVATNSACGGLVGWYKGRCGEIVISNSANYGTITNNGLNNHGNAGLVGSLESNRGTVDGTDTDVTFYNCYNGGAVSGQRVGGIYGITGGGYTNSQGTWVSTGLRSLKLINCTNDAPIHSTTRYGGAFGCRLDALEEALFQNCVNTEKGVFTAPQQYGGGFVGYVQICHGTITFDSCSNYAVIETKGHTAGFVASMADSTAALRFTNCVNTGKITSLTGNAGGILTNGCGSSITIDNCINTGAITATNTSAKASGMATRIDTPALTVTNCINAADLKGNSEVGGIIGYNARSNSSDGATDFTKVENCVHIGKVESIGATNIGGIIGACKDGIVEVRNTVMIGDVITVNGDRVGGIIGSKSDYVNKYHTFENCLVVGTVSGCDTNNCGGIFGYMNNNASCGPNIINCAVYADISSLKGVGAFAGYSNGGNTNCWIKNNIYVGTLTSGTEDDTEYSKLSIHSGAVTYPRTNIINNFYFGNVEYAQCGNATYPVALDPAYETEMTSAVQDLTSAEGMDAFTYVAEADAISVGGKTVCGTVPAAALDVLNAALEKLAAPAPAEEEAPETPVVPEVSTPSTDATPITTPEEFLAMDMGGNYILMEDITLDATYAGVFMGTLDGNGKTITVSAPIFEMTHLATIKNLTVAGEIDLKEAENVGAITYIASFTEFDTVVNNANVSGLCYAAGLAGYTYGDIKATGCINNGTIWASKYEGAGLFGKMFNANVVINNCENNGLITEGDTLGGMIGYVENGTYSIAIFDSVNNGVIDSDTQAGGMIANVSRGFYIYIDGCKNTADLNADGSRAGGMIGTSDNNQAVYIIVDCVNEGDITSGDQTGGIAGTICGYLTIQGCVNYGTIISTNNYAGGIVSRATSNDDDSNSLTEGTQLFRDIMKQQKFIDCVNYGEVSSHRQQVGGILAATFESALFENCRNEGYVHATYIDATNAVPCSVRGCHDNNNKHWVYAGGIAGRINYEGVFYNCVNTGDVSTNNRLGGIAGSVGSDTKDSNTLGPVGYNAFVNCITTGDLYLSGTYSDGATNSIGGIAGYVRNDSQRKALDMRYCAVAGKITAEYTDYSQNMAVGGLVAYANSLSNFMQYNYVVAEIEVDAPLNVVLTTLAKDATTIEGYIANNFTTANSNIEMYSLIDGTGYLPLDASEIVGNTNDLLTKMNALFGAEIYEMEEIEEGVTLPVLQEEKLAVSLVPQPIKSAEEFADMDPFGNYYLAADLTLTESYAHAFRGIFDGGDFTITTTAPVFSALENAVVSNLKIAGDVIGHGTAVGALANTADGLLLTNVVNKANVTNTMPDPAKETSRAYVGGFIGEATGSVEIIECKNLGAVKGASVGGFIGGTISVDLTVVDSTNLGVVTNYAGGSTAGAGFLGYGVGTGSYVFEGCVNLGSIAFNNSTAYTTKTGGIIGYVNSLDATLTISNCVNNASVLGGDQVGGLVGWFKGDVDAVNCVNFGNVLSIGNYAAGIVARADGNAYFTDCSNYGDVTASRQYSGGIFGLGYQDHIFTRCFNAGKISAINERLYNTTDNKDYFIISGGIAASIKNGDFYYCVNVGDIEGNQKVGGIVGNLATGQAKDGNNTLIGNFVSGKLLCTGAGRTAVDANDASKGLKSDKSYGIGGLFGYANGGGLDLTGDGKVDLYTAPIARYNVVIADIVHEFPYTAANADQTPVAGGLSGYYNVGGGIFDHNVFAGTITSETNKCYAGIWSQNGSVTFTNNYIVEGAADMINRVDNGKNAVDVLAEGYEFLFEGVDADFLASLNTSTGVEVFGMTGDMLMHKDTIDVYGRIALEADDFIDPSITETETPVTSDTTTEPETSDPETSDTTTEPTVDTTTEPTVDTTTDPTVDTTTEPTVDTTTEPVDTTTQPDDTTVATSETTEKPETQDTTTDAATTTEPVDGGCGSVIGTATAIVAAMLLVPAALVLKKKDNE